MERVKGERQEGRGREKRRRKGERGVKGKSIFINTLSSQVQERGRGREGGGGEEKETEGRGGEERREEVKRNDH